MSVTEIKKEIDVLGDAERRDLLDYLLNLEQGRNNDLAHSEWSQAIQRRVAEIESGAAVGVPAHEVFERIEKKFRR